jgi:hypothetical protein
MTTYKRVIMGKACWQTADSAVKVEVLMRVPVLFWPLSVKSFLQPHQ